MVNIIANLIVSIFMVLTLNFMEVDRDLALCTGVIIYFILNDGDRVIGSK